MSSPKTLTYLFTPQGVQCVPRDSPAGSRGGSPTIAGSNGLPRVGRSVSALHKNLTFEPTLLWDSSKPYKVPPAPQPKAPPPPKPPPPTEYELVDRATQIREEAAALGDGTTDASKRIQLGMLVVNLASKPGGLRMLIKSWDSKGRGEIQKGEFRLCIRSVRAPVIPTSVQPAPNTCCSRQPADGCAVRMPHTTLRRRALSAQPLKRISSLTLGTMTVVVRGSH